MIIIAVLIVFLSTFLLAALAVGIAWLIMQKREPALAGAPGLSLEDTPTLLKADELSSISLWDRLLARFDFVEGMRTRIEQAGLNWSVGRVTAMMLLIGSFALAVLTSISLIPGWAAAVLAGLAGLGPYLYILRLRSRRFARFEEQFPDALDFLARALRAGHPLSVTLEMLAQENSPPLSTEIRITTDERRLGMPLDQALDNLTKRVPLLSVRIFVAAVQLQSRTGGRLGEALARLAETLRESFALRGEVKALAAHGRTTGAVLTALPIFIGAMMTTVNPGYLDILFNHPYGKHLIFGCIGCLVLAHFVIRKIVDIRL